LAQVFVLDEKAPARPARVCACRCLLLPCRPACVIDWLKRQRIPWSYIQSAVFDYVCGFPVKTICRHLYVIHAGYQPYRLCDTAVLHHDVFVFHLRRPLGLSER
jgi:hypothetical protein